MADPYIEVTFRLVGLTRAPPGGELCSGCEVTIGPYEQVAVFEMCPLTDCDLILCRSCLHDLKTAADQLPGWEKP